MKTDDLAWAVRSDPSRTEYVVLSKKLLKEGSQKKYLETESLKSSFRKSQKISEYQINSKRLGGLN